MEELGGNSLSSMLSASLVSNLRKEFEKIGMLFTPELEGKLTKCINDTVREIQSGNPSSLTTDVGTSTSPASEQSEKTSLLLPSLDFQLEKPGNKCVIMGMMKDGRPEVVRNEEGPESTPAFTGFIRTHLLDIPKNVIIQHLFPCLDHNDLLRLRRVSKQSKALADAYLWTPQSGHQGKWELKINSSKEDKTLEAFLHMNAPPPSRLHIINKDEMEPSEQRSFFEDEHLDEFMRRYSKYVTNLRLDKLFFPFTSAKEIRFYESLVNLKKLRCNEIITVGGAAKFEEKTRSAEGSFIIRPTFKKLKIFRLNQTDCMASMWNFINGLSNNLEEVLHPFHRKDVNKRTTYGDGVYYDYLVNFFPVRELIERRGSIKSQSKLVYDWKYMLDTDALELLRTFASCRDNGVLVKNVRASKLDCLLSDENGTIMDKDELLDPFTGEWILNSQVNYQRNLFVGNVIRSMVGVTDTVFLMELPALEEINIFGAGRSRFQIRPRRGYGEPQWPNLRKMTVFLDHCEEPELHFLLGKFKRPKLEELCLNLSNVSDQSKLPLPKELGKCCVNLKTLTINYCAGDNDFFLGLWEGLPLLENVTLEGCPKLTTKGFAGNRVGGSRPAFLKLEKLKRVAIQNLELMPRITDAAFRNVFRHLKLSSFKLSSDSTIKKISVTGIKELLRGPFAESIEKLDLDKLKLENVSEEELKKVVSCFRSSKML